MKLQTKVASAALLLCFAEVAVAQQSSTQNEWGDGAAYGGGRLLSGAPVPERPVVLTTQRVAGNAIARTKAPISAREPMGECFARITVPAKYRTDERQVVVREEHQTLTFSDPTFESDTVRIKTRDEFVRYKVRQPRWEVETEEIITRPEYERLTVQPAQWKYIDQTVDISVPVLVWRRGTFANSDITRTDPVTGTVFTLVEQPGETRTYRKRVMAAPEKVTARKVPARTTIVTKRVLTDPGGVDSETIPAQYQEYEVQKISEAAQPKQVTIPAMRDMIKTEVMVSPERWDWEPVLCAEHLSAETISAVQTGLVNSGHYSGTVDGVMGPQTRESLRAYQSSQNLTHGGELTFETLQRLGLDNLIR